VYQLREIARITGGSLKGNGKVSVHSIITDSRQKCQDALFVAIKGENLDGHNFVADAISRGASAVLVEEDVDYEPQIRVDDSVAALGMIAHDHVTKFDVQKIGITGTNGKTTTKNLIGSVLRLVGPICIAEKSFNNAIGIPLTIFNLKKEDRFLVLEFGTNHPGEIDYLLGIVTPDIGVLTNVGPGHLEGFGTIENVRKEKTRLLTATSPQGVVIYPSGLAGVESEAEQMTFGIGEGDVCARGIVYDESGSRFTESGREYRLRLLGQGNVRNSLCAIAVGRRLGVAAETICDGIYDCQPVAGRLSLKVAGGIRIIDDSYNSNPVSLREAIDVMVNIKASRRIAVLGDMLEMGADSEEIHKELGREMKGKVDSLLTVGELADNFINGFGGGEHFPNKEELLKNLRRIVQDGDLILVKGSRRMAMEEVVRGLEV